MNQYDVIILGGGAAGLMCAIAAGKRGRRVLVLEGSNKVGKKILMSGGGRCNFTNLNCTSTNFISANPKFCISALDRFTPADFVRLVTNNKIEFHEKTAGQLFCNESSKQILEMLKFESAAVDVEIRTRCGINQVTRESHFVIRSAIGTFSTESLVIATGGLSIPKMGASNLGYKLAEQFELTVRTTRAGLVPFVFSGKTKQLTERLAGVSFPAVMSTNGSSFTDAALFTHRGLSGPAALQASSYWKDSTTVTIDTMPEGSHFEFLVETKNKRPKSVLRTVLSEKLPRALVLELQQLFWPNLADQLLAEVSNENLQHVANAIQYWNLKPAGTEGYRTAEVTLGGVDTAELSSRTMEAKKVSGLYFVGEVVDVTGHLGGHNFQWAWSSGHAAGSVA